MSLSQATMTAMISHRDTSTFYCQTEGHQGSSCDSKWDILQQICSGPRSSNSGHDLAEEQSFASVIHGVFTEKECAQFIDAINKKVSCGSAWQLTFCQDSSFQIIELFWCVLFACACWLIVRALRRHSSILVAEGNNTCLPTAKAGAWSSSVLF